MCGKPQRSRNKTKKWDCGPGYTVTRNQGKRNSLEKIAQGRKTLIHTTSFSEKAHAGDGIQTRTVVGVKERHLGKSRKSRLVGGLVEKVR